ncbi:hypothetical protein BSKO_04922 [Bryopsis sp. KO-2023]|nr:hypothetical protein BSKO_04922 [Bryopsis sp. KO-2023]
MSSDIEATRQSLLDIVLNQRKNTGKNVTLSRVVYVARLSQKQNCATHIQGAFDELLLKCQAKDIDITGIMVVYSWCLVHMFEAKTSSITSLLKDIEAMDPAKTFIQEIKAGFPYSTYKRRITESTVLK